MVATVVLRQGSGSATCPRLYAVHGLDGDVMGGGSSYVTLAGQLTSWRVVALGYDEEAYACGSVQALAACYNRRVLEDVSKNGKSSAENPIVVAGYSFGCALAHQMACQLSQDGLDVLLILFDLEVTWPPPKTNARVGGYDFLGGEVEAILLLSRAFGKFEFAHQAVVLLTAAKANSESIDVDLLRREAFAAINHRGMSYELFSALVKKSGINIERIHTISDPWHPPEKYIGPALLVLAPDSAEFAGAKEINEQYCTQMEVVCGRGSHYNLLQGDHAILAADLLHNFCQRFSPAVSRMPNGGRVERPSKAATRQAIGEDKLLILRRGSPGTPKVYLVHGLDGDVMSGGATFKTIAVHLDPCRVGALIYDSEALACDSVPALCSLYNSRVLSDSEGIRNGAEEDGLIVVAGYSYGCVLAHQMGSQLQQAGVNAAVVMFDLEVTWPPPQTNERVGGYEFLGGEAEAILLICRGFGKFEFAMKEAMELVELRRRNEGFDVDALRERAFKALNQRGMSFELFTMLVKRGGVNIQQLHTIADPWEPPQKYDGPALLVLAPDSQEFAGAKEINAQFCTAMEVATGAGSHYNMMQGAQAAVQAHLVKDFLQRVAGVDVASLSALSPPSAPQPTTKKKGEIAKKAKVGDDKLLILRRGTPGTPKVYLVHGLDGDVMSGGATFKTIAGHLEPCRVGALIYDSEALACDSVPALCSLYNSRVLSDSEGIRNGAEEDGLIVVAGYSYGCVLAHQMGSQLQQAGVNAAVVMFDLEVTWPPPQTNERVGGYEFLGGEAEAILLICRGFGKFEFAMKEAMELAELRRRNEGFDVDALRERAFKALNQRGMSFELFTMLVKRGGVNIQQLHTIADPWEPPQKYDGPALLVLAPDSQEFAGAKEINAQFCTAMEVAMGAGSHYNMMQGAQAAVQADLVKHFLQRLGVDFSMTAPSPSSLPQQVSKKKAVGDDKLLVLRPGSAGSTQVYLVHGLDGDVMSGGATFKTIAGHLEPCRVSALIYDSEALSCKSVPSLCEVYNKRVLQDSESFRKGVAGGRIIVAGYSYGCVLAHQMGYQLQQAGVDVGVVMFDLEVTWPPPKTNARVGGYDFLGGEAEAILLITRGFGKFEFATKEAMHLAELRRKNISIDVDDLRERAFQALNQRGMSKELFTMLVKRGGLNIEQLHTIADPWKPPGVYEGPALLVLAPDSPEFSGSRETNAEYCTQMEVEVGAGSHYNMLQGEHAQVQAELVKQFLQRLPAVVPPSGVSLVKSEEIPRPEEDSAPIDLVEGIRSLRNGPGPCTYFLHGLDGDALGPGMSLGSLPSMMPGRVCAVEYDDEAFACESIESLSLLYKRRILEDRGKTANTHELLLAGRSTGALLACMIALQLQKEQVRCSLLILDSEVVWPSKLDNSFCYDWLGGEVEATFWLARLAGATEFVEEQVQSAVTRGQFVEGASRLQTAAFGQIATNLTAFGVNSLKDFRNVCTLAASNCTRLRQLMQPTAGSMRTPPGIFDGKVLIVSGDERVNKLRQVASLHCRNISMCIVNTDDVYVGEAAHSIAKEISLFLRASSQDKRRSGPEVTPVGNSAREEEAQLVSLEAISSSIYLVPGSDGSILGDLSALAQVLDSDTCHLDFDEEACRCSTLPDVAALFLRRIFLDQGWTTEEDWVQAKHCKVVLVGHRSGAALAYEMAMQLQDSHMDVRLVIIQGEVFMAGPQNGCLSDCWLGSTCEATLALAQRLGATEFAAKEAEAMAAARKESHNLSKGRLQATCGLAFDGISRGYLNGHPKNGVHDDSTLLMKAFWKLSDQLNGLSVDRFKEMVQDMASRMDWYRNLGSGHDEAFDGPALLILGDNMPPEEAEAIIESNALYCTDLEVADVIGNEYSCMNDDNIRMLAAQILSWQEKPRPYMNGSE